MPYSKIVIPIPRATFCIPRSRVSSGLRRFSAHSRKYASYAYIGFESGDRGGFVILHETAVAGDVRAENCCELAVEAFLLHGGTSISWKIHRVVKGKEPAERTKWNSARRVEKEIFSDLFISQSVGDIQEQT
jgi:hypothetical protein